MKRAITFLYLLSVIPISVAAQETPKGTQDNKTGNKSTNKPSTLKLYDVPAPQEFGGQTQEEVAEYVKITKATDPKEQAELIEAFLKRYPKSQYNQQLYQLAAEDYQKINNPEKLIEYGEKALESSPNQAAIMAVLALTYSTRGDAEKAIERGTKAVSILESLEPAPNTDQALFATQRNRFLAITYTGLGTAFLIRYEKAMKARTVNQAPQEPIQTAGQNPEPETTGSAASPPKPSEEAKSSPTEKTPPVSAASPVSPDASSLDLSKAKGYFSRALELNSDYEFAVFQLGMACAYDRQVAPTLEAFSKVIAMGGPLAALAKENFERIYKITHKNSLEGSEELLEKAKSAWAERKQTTK